MQIFLNGPSCKKLITTPTSYSNLINEAKDLVSEDFILTLNSMLLTPDYDLSTITPLSQIEVAPLVEGAGKKKRKKKVYSTPKKNHHVHKNRKLGVLDYYVVEKDGKIKRVNKECVNSTCAGKGIFMANMWNRHYCGNCHTTLIKKDAPKEEPKKKAVVAEVVADKKDDKAAKGGKKGGKKK